MKASVIKRCFVFILYEMPLFYFQKYKPLQTRKQKDIHRYTQKMKVMRIIKVFKLVQTMNTNSKQAYC